MKDMMTKCPPSIFLRAAWSRQAGKSFLWLGVAAVVWGCTAAPNAQNRDGESAAAMESCTVVGECAPIAAKTAFGNLLARAVAISPEVSGAKADLAAARAGVKAARKGLFPQVGIEARAERSTDTAVIALKQPIWGAGKLRAAIAEAEANLRGAEAALQNAQLEASLKMIDAVGRWVETSNAVQALAAALTDYNETVDMVARRVGQGVAGESEQELVAARRGTVVADLRAAEASRDMARATLSSLLGTQVSDSALASASAVSGAASLPSGAALDAVVANSPAIRVADATIARVTAAVSSAKADRFPTLSVVGEQQLTGLSGANTANSQKVYLGLSANVGPGRGTGDRVAAALSQVDSQTAAKDVRMRALRDELTALDLRHQSAKDRLNAYDRSIDASRAVLGSYRAQMASVGGKTWQDVLSATRELADARRARAASEAELIVTYWKLKAYIQGLSAL